jgi:hypothetical protein
VAQCERCNWGPGGTQQLLLLATSTPGIQLFQDIGSPTSHIRANLLLLLHKTQLLNIAQVTSDAEADS